MAHITGGGITENLPRILSGNLKAQVVPGSWNVPPVFRWLSEAGGVGEREMLRTLNCGIGLIAVVAPENEQACVNAFVKAGEEARPIGVLKKARGDPRVEYSGRLFS
jgi:phosphoribosylformylglycinamidine cyclo-ligase